MSKARILQPTCHMSRSIAAARSCRCLGNKYSQVHSRKYISHIGTEELWNMVPHQPNPKIEQKSSKIKFICQASHIVRYGKVEEGLGALDQPCCWSRTTLARVPPDKRSTGKNLKVYRVEFNGLKKLGKVPFKSFQVHPGFHPRSWWKFEKIHLHFQHHQGVVQKLWFQSINDSIQAVPRTTIFLYLPDIIPMG